MTDRKCADAALVRDFLEIRKWHLERKQSLQDLIPVFDLLSKEPATGKYRVQICVDSCDIITYCFPYYNLFTGSSSLAGEEKRQAELLRDHAARACVFHKVPFERPVIALPPHFQELLGFVDRVRHSATLAEARENLLDWVAPDLPAVLSSLRDLQQRWPSNRQGKADEDALAILCKEFCNVALVVIGVYETGLHMLSALFHDGLIGDASLGKGGAHRFTMLQARLVTALDEPEPDKLKRSDRALLEDYEHFLTCFCEVRDATLQNKNDATVVALLRAANRNAQDHGILHLLVSSADSMAKVFDKLGEAAFCTWPDGQQRAAFMPLRHFYNFLQIGDTASFDDVNEKNKEESHRAYSDTLRQLNRELEELDKNTAIQDDFSAFLVNCGVELEADSDRQIRCSGDEQCPLRHESSRTEIRESIESLAKLRKERENARSLRQRHPILAPYLQRIERGPATHVAEDLTEAIKGLGEDANWSSLLQDRIHRIEAEFSAEVGELAGELVAFSADLPAELLDTFWEFPYRVRFLTSSLRDLAKAAAERVRENDSAGVQAAIREFSLAGALPEARNESDLVRVIALGSFSRWSSVVDVCTRWLSRKPEGPTAHEMRYVRARAYLTLFTGLSEEKRDLAQLLKAKDDCRRALDADPEDARILNLLAIVLGLLHTCPRLGEIERPTANNITDVLRRALDCAESSSDPTLRGSILNNWAYFLVNCVPICVEDARELLKRIDNPRSEWLAGWIDTDGFTDLVEAEASKNREFRKKLAASAIAKFEEALRVAHSPIKRRALRAHMRRALNVEKDTSET
jgi:hypothetical protein